MRKYADLKEPLPRGDGDPIVRIMLYEAEEGTYHFEYDAADALQCCADLLYASAEEACEEWNALIDESGWTEIGDPLPGCQHDAFIPLRVKRGADGKPKWGEYETLRDGEWVRYEA